MDAPQYLWDLLNRELIFSHTELLRKVATKYDIPFAELVDEFIPKNAKLIPNKEQPIMIHKKMKPKKEPSDDTRCCARIWNRGKGGRCTRSQAPNCEYCLQHSKDRKHGDFRESAPREIYPKKKQLMFV